MGQATNQKPNITITFHNPNTREDTLRYVCRIVARAVCRKREWIEGGAALKGEPGK